MRQLPTFPAIALALFVSGCGASVHCLASPATGPRPSSDERVAHRTHPLRAQDETCLHAQAWTPREPPVRGVVVVVHGLRDHSSRYDALARALGARGYAVHAADLRGHGRSGGERQFVDSLSVHVEDVARVVAHARAEHPDAPIFLLGHSMGGAIATLLALEAQGSLAGLVLSAPALQIAAGTSELELGLVHFFAGVLPHLDTTTLDGEAFSRDPAVRAADERDPLVVRSAIPARTASGIVRAIETIQAREDELRLPLLLLHGTEDRVTPRGGTARLYVRASSVDATLRLYRGLYHDLFHEPEHDRVTSDLIGWLDERTETSASVPAATTRSEPTHR